MHDWGSLYNKDHPDEPSQNESFNNNSFTNGDIINHGYY